MAQSKNKRKNSIYFISCALVAMAVIMAVYFVLIGTGVVNFRTSQILVTAGSGELIYNGKNQKYEHYELQGELKKGDKIVATFPKSGKSVGKYTNTVVVTIVDRSGKDVTKNYEMKVIDGEFDIVPIKITVASPSTSKVYDGTPLVGEKGFLFSGKPLEGDVIKFSEGASITEPGVIDNDFQTSIVDSFGNDVSKNYDINYLPGKLTVYENKNVHDNDSLSNRPPNYRGATHLKLATDYVGSFYSTTKYTNLDAFGNGNIDIPEYSYGMGSVYGISDFLEQYPENLNVNLLTGYALYSAMIGGSRTDLKSNFAEMTTLTGRISAPNYAYDVQELEKNGSTIKYTSNFIAYDYLADSANRNVGTQLKQSSQNCIDLERDYAKFVKANYLTIDETFKSMLLNRVMEMGFDYSSFQEPSFDMYSAVKRFVKTCAEYNDNDFIIPSDVDNVILHFLNNPKIEDNDGHGGGICQHFAATATMLYRALGVPARYTVGYQKDVEVADNSGETQLDTSLIQTADILDRDCHAWVEIYIDGLGWVMVDVTPSSGGPQEVLPPIPPLPGTTRGTIYLDIAVDGAVEKNGKLVVTYTGQNLKILHSVSEESTIFGLGFEGYEDDVQVSVEPIINIGDEYMPKISVKVVDYMGEDVTGSYDIFVNRPTIMVERQKLSIMTETKQAGSIKQGDIYAPSVSPFIIRLGGETVNYKYDSKTGIATFTYGGDEISVRLIKFGQPINEYCENDAEVTITRKTGDIVLDARNNYIVEITPGDFYL